jgi:hypothetical protein
MAGYAESFPKVSRERMEARLIRLRLNQLQSLPLNLDPKPDRKAGIK